MVEFVLSIYFNIIYLFIHKLMEIQNIHNQLNKSNKSKG